MRVIAAPGLKVPKEDNPREYIGADPVDVPDTSYYRRLRLAGDLIEQPAQTGQASTPSSAKPSAATRKGKGK
ncbi:DUF2635 domain-containing protein [Pseudomonas putida]|uniref:DUF2635 domain-containing protein n=1 Tax=Pseudomonas putida TaxID=303 RepID=UPI001C2446AB|nr:DUF2635 domain-containing protein [Pseudomonas putida]